MSELLEVDEAVWIWVDATGIPIYDFDFRMSFPVNSPWRRPESVTAIARCGALDDYEASHAELVRTGVQLVHSPEQHRRASDLSHWYPLLADMTPRSVVYSTRPSGNEIAADFRFPVFVKGARQTSRHLRALSFIASPTAFDAAMKQYAVDSILRWQPVVVRELAPLRPVEDPQSDRIPSSFEFRTFWWNGHYVGGGRYWWQGRPYEWTATERAAALTVGEEAADRMKVPFLVVDLAMTTDGRWLVIECNDGQESGYAGVSPIGLWQCVIDRCRR